MMSTVKTGPMLAVNYGELRATSDKARITINQMSCVRGRRSRNGARPANTRDATPNLRAASSNGEYHRARL